MWVDVWRGSDCRYETRGRNFFLLFPAVSPATFLSARCRLVVTLPTKPAQRPFLKLCVFLFEVREKAE
jgi:hypothetical protein